MNPQEIEKILEENINFQKRFFSKLEKELKDQKILIKRLERRIKNIELKNHYKEGR